MQAQFYINPMTKVSYLNSIQTNPSILEGLDVYVMVESYTFNDIDKLSAIKENSANTISSTYSLNNTIIRDTTDTIILDANDINIELDTDYVGSAIQGIVFANKKMPVFYVNTSKVIARGTSTLLNFADTSSRILKVYKKVDEADTGHILIKTRATTSNNITINRPNEINRSNISLKDYEDTDDRYITDKYAAYRDISNTGKAHPLSGDLITLKGVAAVNQSLRNILLANAYERPFTSQQIAGNLNSFLFDFNDSITADELKTGISMAIVKHEPRVSLIDVIVTSYPEKYSTAVKIIYAIKTTDTINELNLLLDRA